MKYKQLGLLALIPMLLVALLGQGYVLPVKRYHQHLEVQEKKPCSDHGDDVFCTHLPLMHIETDAEIPHAYTGVFSEFRDPYSVYKDDRNYERVGATISFFNDPEKNNHLTDAPAFQERAKIRVRGASSREFPKKGYALKFFEDDMLQEKEISIDGMAADEDWILNGPYLDKTLVRNYLCYNLAGEIMDYSPNIRFIELFINEEYEGVYLLLESVKRGTEGRIKLGKSDPTNPVTPFLCVIDRGSRDANTYFAPFSLYMNVANMQDNKGGKFEILYPSATLTEDQKKYIERYISKMEKSIYSFDYSDPKKGFRAYMDERSLIDYFIVNEFTANLDSMVLSTYFYKDARSKLRMAVWDFNETFFDDLTVMQKYSSLWYSRILKDPEFNRKLVHRYYSLRNSYLSDEYLLNYVDEALEYLGPAIQRNEDRWRETYYDYTDEYDFNMEHRLGLTDSVWTTEEAIQQLKDAIILRADFMDQHMDRLYLLCHNSLNKKYNYAKGERFK